MRKTTALLSKIPRLPKKDTTIWRFMSLAKYIDLITRRSLALTQLSVLQRIDPAEGSFGADRLNYLKRMMTDDEFARQEFCISPSDPIPQHLRAAYDPAQTAWQNQRSAERTYINCWHINPIETAHLWSVYAGKGEGVAIQTTVGRLVESFGGTVRDLAVAPIRYVDYHTYPIGPSFENVVFYKRENYKSEKELRIRYLLPFERCTSVLEDGRSVWAPPPGVYWGVDCEKLIEKIYISPSLGDWFVEALEKMNANIGVSSPVVKSSINNPAIL